MSQNAQLLQKQCSPHRVWNRCLLLAGILLAAGWLSQGTKAPAATYQVGPTRSYHTVGSLPALNPGDVVEIDPAIYNEVKRWTRAGTAAAPIVIRGIGPSRSVFDATNQTVNGSLPNPRAVFQVEANYITLENLEFKNARNGNNGAGIRITSANNVTVRNCKITNCDMGMMSDNNSNLLIEASEIAYNGTALYDGYSHNLYLGGNSATLRFCHIHDALYGQNFKSRGHYTELLYCYIADSQDGEVGLVDAAETAAAQSHAVMVGNIVISKPRLSGYNSRRFVQFGQDSGGDHNGTLFAFNNTFIAGDSRIEFLSANAAGASIEAQNNIFHGSDRIAGSLGVGISGSNNWVLTSATLPASFFGTIRGSDAGFINRAQHNLHLTSGSACRDRGVNGLTFRDGGGTTHSVVPALEYTDHLKNRPRPDDGQIDIGAYEYRLPVTAIRLMGRDCLIDFTAVAGSQYDLEITTALASNSWSPLVTNIPGIDGTVQLTDTNAVSHSVRFYRVKSSM